LVSPLGGPHSIRGIGAQAASGALSYTALNAIAIAGACVFCAVIAQRYYRGAGVVAERAKCRQRAAR
jgi:hypothetical protein